MAKEQIYYVKGMHCASCEILIEKKLLDIGDIKSVDASTQKGQVVIEYENEKPALAKINEIFKKDKYVFFDTPNASMREGKAGKPINKTLIAFNIALFAIIAFLLLDRMGVSGLFGVGSGSSLAAFFIFGLLAGISTCAALVGGIVLSMSKQWQELYAGENVFYKKIQPHILFNIGRIASYALLGGVLGFIGNRLQISLGFTSFLVIAISLLMTGLALQMLGVKAFCKFQFSMPKSITRYVANENNFKGKYMPFLMGAATFFLPCGFTITVQSLALLSGSALQGALMMGFFALGTAPMLLLIGFSSTAFFGRPHVSVTFSKVAGFLVLFFALFNIYNQLNVLGFFNSSPAIAYDNGNLAPVVNGKQVIKMTATGLQDSPDYFLVKAGIPVRWEITGSGQLGCNGTILSNGLFTGSIYLTPNQVTIKEFTPQNPGKYRFSCPMGMVTGSIEVVN